MHIKQEKPVLPGQLVWDNRALRGGQYLDADIHNLYDGSCTNPALAGLQIQLCQQQQDRRSLKAQHGQNPQLNQLTQQDIIAWTQGLSHRRQVHGCHPPQQELPQPRYPQTNQNQIQLYQQRFVKMEDSKHFPYILASDHECWPVSSPRIIKSPNPAPVHHTISMVTHYDSRKKRT
jgi:hypothetical protein